jgi:hypothetical protein
VWERITPLGFARLDRAERFQAGLQIRQDFLGPGLLALEVLMAGQDLAIRRDQVEPWYWAGRCFCTERKKSPAASFCSRIT